MRITASWFEPWMHSAGRTGPELRLDGGHAGPPKPEQFRILTEAGFSVPPHGKVGEVLDSWWKDEGRLVRHVVAYTDLMAHCGEGKRVISYWELQSNPHMGAPGGDRFWHERQLFCSAFVGEYHPSSYGKDIPAIALRRLQIGRHVFWVEQTSVESWLSNCGDGHSQVVGQEWNAGYHNSIKLPLFAIDFVWGRHDLYAVDFNKAPGIQGSGVEKLISGPDICAELERALLELELP